MSQNILPFLGQIVSPLTQANATTAGLLWTVDVPGAYQLSDGLRISFLSPESAAGAALQLAVSGLPAKAVVRWDMGVPQPTDIGRSGQPVEAIYSQALDKFVLVASNVAAPVYAGNKNLLINGAMRIDQRRNGGAGAWTSNFSVHAVDRWFLSNTSSGTITAQQITATDGPAGFGNYQRLTMTVADTNLTAAKNVFYSQNIEAANIASTMFGTSRATAVTLQFWVRSSVAGTYCGRLANKNATRSYVFTYTVNSANTWEYKIVTIPGDIGGTWLVSGNDVGINVLFDLGCGSNLKTTPGSWANGNFTSTTGTAVALISNAAAVMDITGVQMEIGTVATPFERLHYGAELLLCQRYYQVGDSSHTIWSGMTTSGTVYYLPQFFKTPMRAAPTISYLNANQLNFNAPSFLNTSPNGFYANAAANATAAVGYFSFDWRADAEV